MIDEITQKELRKKYNPDGSEFREKQLATLEVLKYIKGVCDEHSIKYWLASGTLLGAVRHGGFIPWDDDVDIDIPYSELQKLKNVILQDDKYDWHDNSTDPHYWQRFPKIRSRHKSFNENALNIDKQIYSGCYVDIFPIEKMPDWFIKPCAIMLSTPVKWHNSDNRLKNKIANIVYRTGQAVLIPCFRFFSSLFRKSYFHNSFGVYFPKRRVVSDDFETVDIKFEDTLFKAPKDYSAYLEALYGKSYMELPDESIRTNHS